MGKPQSKDLQPLQRQTVSVTFQYGSVNGPPDTDTPTHEALITGTSLGGRMSAVRRFFSLLTTFDFLFSVFLWFVCAILNGDTPAKALESEVLHYSVHKSLFDVVLLSASRFVVIILTYALFRISHWFMVAITTASTGAFIIAKVFIYDWKSQTNPLVAVFLLMCSFIISWGEAWFLDFRVLPYEDKASLLLARQVNERTALLTSQRTQRPTSPCPSDLECFYSPQGSDTESDTCNDENFPVPLAVLTPEDLACKQQAEQHLEVALSLVSQEDWRTEKIVDQDIVQSLKTTAYGKVFKFVGNVNLSASQLFDEIVHNCESYSWNPAVKLVRRLRSIDESCDVVYVVASEGAGGLVSPRDFINSRTWLKRGNSYMIGMGCSTHYNLPKQKGITRGEQGPSIYICTPCQDNSSSCQVQWLLNTSLKGWVPQYVIDQALAGAMLDYVAALRSMAEKLCTSS